MYKAVTRGISVTVTPRYMPEESSPDHGRYFFAYTVEIINTSLDRVQLRARRLGSRTKSATVIAASTNTARLRSQSKVPVRRMAASSAMIAK